MDDNIPKKQARPHSTDAADLAESFPLAWLRCPVTRSKLTEAPPALIDRLNERMRSGELRNRVDEKVTRPLRGGLVNAGGDLLYPIYEQAPHMLVDEAIPLEQEGR